MEFLKKSISIPFFDSIERVVRSLTSTGRLAFIILAALLVGSSLSLAIMVSRQFLVTVPAPGGALSEGIVGTPRFLNPVLALSDADRDLVSLVYSGLLRATPSGDLVGDLASSYSVSEDGRTYTFVLRDNATFGDGTPVTADDVLYTVARAQDPGVKSPKRANWDGVIAEKISDKEVSFTLRSAYAPFIENATLGILPKHLWEDVTSEEFPFSTLNAEPIGSGPYKIASVTRNASGIPLTYKLVPFSGYTLGKPYLSSLTLSFYENEDALIAGLKSGSVEAASNITPALLAELSGFTVRRAPLNRVFGVFFNQNQSEVLRNADVRNALNRAIDRNALVTQVLGGFGTPLTEPLPAGLLPQASAPQTTATTGFATLNAGDATTTNDLALAAQAYLLKKGWTLDPQTHVLTHKKDKKTTEVLRFTIATSNVPELRAAAEFVRKEWVRMGADVEVKIFEQGDLNQNVIRPRKYDALLFGEVIGREIDLFAFWHSSQRNDPGLNIALYANATADSLLEGIRVAQTDAARRDIYQKFRVELNKDNPAVFLYSPDFTYVFPSQIHGMEMSAIGSPAERFLDVYQWHVESDYVWEFLTRWAR
jgi:peptide/nickel transport system substrate-binding protein